MAARAHLLDAYRLMHRRTGQALLTGRADGPSPLRRMNIALVCGLLVGLVALAGTAVASRRSPADTLDRPGTLVIERETGARYVRCGPHRLCPALNYTSARLAAGPGFLLRTASRRDVAGFGRGPSLGVQGAPDSLPDARHLVGGSWAACVTGSSAVTLVLGRSVGHPLDGATTVPVTSADHSWLLQGGLRHLVTGPAPAGALQVPMTWLTNLPIGPDIPTPPSLGASGGPLCLGPFGVSSGGALPGGGPLYLPPGGTAVVDVQSNGAHKYALLADGRRYDLASVQVLRLLGYKPGDAVAVPAVFLTGVPAGPALDRIPLP